MLQRRISSNGVTCYVAPVLERIGVPHAFSTRLGGVSLGPFASLNLGNPAGCEVEDAPERIQANYSRLEEAAGLAGRSRCWAHQVHGARALAVRAGRPWENGVPADALICDDPARLVAVRVADCVPVLLARQDGQVVAAVHAGWRGLVAGVLPAAIHLLCDDSGPQRASTPGQLVAAIGPCISGEAYEVGADVLEQFTALFGDKAPIQRRVGERGLLDLRQAARLQLQAAGLPSRQIDVTNRCTYRHTEEFFSHRRDNGVTGRMAAVIGPRGGKPSAAGATGRED